MLGRSRPSGIARARSSSALSSGLAWWVEPGLAIGAVAGGLTVMGFTVLHDIIISDVWFGLMPMLIASVLCGLCLACGCRTTAGSRSAVATPSRKV